MTREQLLASLVVVAPANAWQSDDPDDQRYADWTSRLSGGCYVLEVGDAAGEAVQLEMTLDDLAGLHRQLTLTLLADSEPDTR